MPVLGPIAEVRTDPGGRTITVRRVMGSSFHVSAESFFFREGWLDVLGTFERNGEIYEATRLTKDRYCLDFDLYKLRQIVRGPPTMRV